MTPGSLCLSLTCPKVLWLVLGGKKARVLCWSWRRRWEVRPSGARPGDTLVIWAPPGEKSPLL